jgi:hypothetical protein
VVFFTILNARFDLMSIDSILAIKMSIPLMASTRFFYIKYFSHQIFHATFYCIVSLMVTPLVSQIKAPSIPYPSVTRPNFTLSIVSLPNIQQYFQHKLTRNNYLMWHVQFLPYFKAHHLLVMLMAFSYVLNPCL